MVIFGGLGIAAAGLLLGGGSFLAGKSSSGGGIELFTSKKSNQTTNANQYTTSSVFSPTINRTTDIQYNIASGGSQISTKKDQAISQIPNISPNVSPSLTASPSTQQGGGSTAASKGGVDFQGIALMGGVGLIAYYFLKPKKKSGK